MPPTNYYGSKVRLAPWIASLLPRVNALGNAVVPHVAELIGHAILAAHQREEVDAR